LLKELTARFSRIGWLLDTDAELRTVVLREKLGVKTSRLELPKGFADPGELTREGASTLYQNLSRSW
jgi:hypothetical protein